jgi:hypothetical protein
MIGPIRRAKDYRIELHMMESMRQPDGTVAGISAIRQIVAEQPNSTPARYAPGILCLIHIEAAQKHLARKEHERAIDAFLTGAREYLGPTFELPSSTFLSAKYQTWLTDGEPVDVTPMVDLGTCYNGIAECHLAMGHRLEVRTRARAV